MKNPKPSPEAESEERFRLIVESVKDYAIFMLDPNGNVRSWNEGARRLKGFEASEIIGQHFSKFYPREAILQGKPQWELDHARTEGRAEDEDWRVRKDGSRFWANVVISRITDQLGNVIGFSKVTRDLTERRAIEEKVRRLNEGLERRVRERTSELERALAARDEFLSIASHELKTPLTSLQLQLQLTRRQVAAEITSPSKALVDGLEFGLRQGSVLARLIDDLLDVSRIRGGGLALNLQTVQLSEVVGEVLKRLSIELTESGCTVQLELDPAAWGRWDRHRLEQVLGNLVSNAIKYAPGSAIRIRTAFADGRATLLIEDSGPGIDMAEQARVFERFERANGDHAVAGMGLGLYIVRQIVEAHGGSIRVESEPGKGARFIVELPAEPASARADGSARPA